MECPVCLERLESPVTCCVNGHPLCPKCPMNMRTCPLCSSTFSNQQHTFINQLVTTFPFRCRYSLEGCSEILVPDNLKNHEKVCEYRYVDCPLLTTSFTKCITLVSQRSYTEHIEQCHQSYITTYCTKEWEYIGVLPVGMYFNQINCYYSVIKDNYRHLYFIVMTHYDKKAQVYQISVHFLGKQSEAHDYIYTINVKAKDFFEEFVYSNKCIPKLTVPDEAKRFYPFELRDIDGMISSRKEGLKFSVKIRNKDDFKNKDNPKIIEENDDIIEIPISKVPKKRKTADSLLTNVVETESVWDLSKNMNETPTTSTFYNYYPLNLFKE